MEVGEAVDDGHFAGEFLLVEGWLRILCGAGGGGGGVAARAVAGLEEVGERWGWREGSRGMVVEWGGDMGLAVRSILRIVIGDR